MATLTTLRDAVAQTIGLDNTTTGDQAQIDRWLNQGVLEVLLATECTVECATLDTIANTWKYQLPTGILAIKDMWREDAVGAATMCLREPYPEILRLRRGSAISADSTQTHYATIGANLLVIWPTPQSIFTLNVFYVPRPTAMSTGSHDPSTLTYGRVPAEFHELIELWALGKAADYDDDQSSQQGDRYRILYERGVREARKKIRMKGGTRLAPIRIGHRRRPPVPKDPSVVIR